MKETLLRLAAAVPLGLFAWAVFLVVTSPAEPPFDWRLHMTAAAHDAIVANLNHRYTYAAYALVWAIQLGYLVWLGFKWQAQKRAAARPPQ